MNPVQIIGAIGMALDLVDRLTSVLEAFDDDKIDKAELQAIRDRARKSDQRIDAKARKAGIIE